MVQKEHLVKAWPWLYWPHWPSSFTFPANSYRVLCSNDVIKDHCIENMQLFVILCPRPELIQELQIVSSNNFFLLYQSHFLIIKIQDGTNPVPSSWIVQEPPPATSSCSSPCSSWVARVSLKDKTTHFYSFLIIIPFYQIFCWMGFRHCQHLRHLPCQQNHVQVLIDPKSLKVFLLWEIAGSNSMGFQLYQLSSSFAQRFLPQIFTSWTFSCYISGAS